MDDQTERSEGVTVKELRKALAAIARALDGAKEELTRLDSAIGDGDLGITLSRGFAALDRLAYESPGDDLGALFIKLGVEMNRVSPSTMGTLIATAFLRGGKRGSSTGWWSGEQLGEVLAGMVEGIEQRGKARVGDKTILDAFVPAVDAYRAAIDSGACIAEAWFKATEAAEAGYKKTVEMPSKVGRAGWFGAKTVGTPDPGAYACAVIFRAVSDELRSTAE